MAKETIASVLIDAMHGIEEEYRDILSRRAANRRTLRDLGTQGLLTDEEATLVEETYPARQRSEEEASEEVAA